ncbi:MAG TPA: CaiB/BaiF CoA-transferase family protein [Candidatus Binatia bacterium]|nr:CaiB/BaiF CoA-transferase family protein [Candidatus Binatia bacterium]
MNTVAALSSALEGTVTIESGDERGEFAGMLLASFGAEVIKLEGRRGSNSRRLGPFATPQHDPEQSLCFCRYNLGKKSVSLEVDHPAARGVLERLAQRTDVVIDSGEAADVERRLTLYRDMQASHPQLIVCTITPFGLDGPYRDLKMTDLTQLAMGGVMASCGYDARPDGVYDTPPIAPGIWQAYHIACEYAVIAITAALNFRELTGEGDLIDLSIHETVSTCTEVALPSYIYNAAVVQRQTGRHAAEGRTRPWLRRTKDGRYVKAFMFWGKRDVRVITEMLNEAGVEHDLDSEAYRELAERSPSAAQAHFSAMIDKLVASMTAEEVFHRAQAKGLLWASVRYPEENLDDPHFQARGTFQLINHPAIGRAFYYPVSVATDGKQRVTAFERGAPHLGEHTREVLTQVGFSGAEISALAAAGAI